MIEFNEDKQNRKVSDLLKHEEEELVQLLSAKHGLDYVDLTVTLINTDALRLIEEDAARASKAAAYSLIDKKLKIAVRNPTDEKTQEIIDGLKEKGYTTI